MYFSDDLYQLIRSMTKSEKGYFKKYVAAFNREEKNNYIKLFDEIESLARKDKSYDESKVKTARYTGKFVKNFPFHKNYLYNLILICLCEYHAPNRNLIQLRAFITQSEILFDKSLYSQSLKVLKKAKKIASDLEFFPELITILIHEKLIYKYTLEADDYVEHINQIYDQHKAILDKLDNKIEYSFLSDQRVKFKHKLRTGFARDSDQLKEMENFFNHDLITNEKNAKSFYSKLLYYDMNSNYSEIKKDYEAGIHYTQKRIELLENNTDKTGGRLDNYLLSLNNLLTFQIRTKKLEDAEQTCIKMNSTHKKFPKLVTDKNRVYIFYSTSVLMLSNYMANHDFKKLSDLKKKIEKTIDEYESRISLYDKISLFYLLAAANFILSDYDTTIKWISKIVNLEKTDSSQDYQCFARIMYVICCYELGYLDSLEYALKSTYHFLSKRKRVYKYESIILKYLRKAFKIKTNKELDEMLIDMRHDLKKIYDDKFEQNAFDTFNILYWLESKIRKVPIMEVMRQQ